jgi:hypothetical protein
VKWLLGYIQTHRFTVFAWYRIVLGAALLAWAQASPAAPNAADAAAPPDAAFAMASSGGTSTATLRQSQPDPRRTAGRTAEARARAQFLHAHTCLEYARLKPRAAEDAARLAETRRALADAPDNDMTRMQRDQVMAWEAGARLVARAASECEASGPVTAREFAAAALRAAEFGDFSAAECYILKPAVDIPAPDLLPPVVQTPAELAARAAYAASARRLIAAGLSAGDWRMARLAMTYADPRMSYTGIADPSDPTVAYRMASLLRHGLSEPRRRDEMTGVATFAAQSLDRAQLAQADAWVAAQLPTFARTPPIGGHWMCAMPGLEDG